MHTAQAMNRHTDAHMRSCRHTVMQSRTHIFLHMHTLCSETCTHTPAQNVHLHSHKHTWTQSSIQTHINTAIGTLLHALENPDIRMHTAFFFFFSNSALVKIPREKQQKIQARENVGKHPYISRSGHSKWRNRWNSF